MKKRWQWRHFSESIMKGVMLLSLAIVLGSLIMILWTVLVKGIPAMSWSMITQAPKGGYFLDNGGGILNAILGSLYLAGGGTLIALLLSIPIALYLETYLENGKWGGYVRLALDVLWGIPSIVYGIFGFILMLAMGLRSSLLGGIIVLALLELPIMVRAMDEVIRQMPADLEHAAMAMGYTRLEMSMVIIRQMMPGIITAILLAFGRGIGDAASVLFTAGYTDRIPSSLLSPSASLPLAIFFQLSTPYPQVQQRAYASALILTLIVLVISLASRLLSAWFSKFTIK